MQHLGIFAKTFVRPSIEENAQAIVLHGFHVVQYNLRCAGLDSLPKRIGPDTTASIRQVMEERGIRIAALSGTFNMIHPDTQKRQEGLVRLHELALHASDIGTAIITLCTGTRDPEDMWHAHPGNTSSVAWKDLCLSMEVALKITQEAGVVLAIEPEIANVVDSACQARRLLNEMQSSRLKIILDPANLFHTHDRPEDRHRMLHEAFELLSADIVLAHAKDVLFRGDTVVHCPAGSGVLDYDDYLALLQQIDVPLILHGLDENEVPATRAFLQRAIESKKMSVERRHS